MEYIRDYFTIDLEKVRVLQVLKDRGTIAATAEVLHLTPSAVSQQIANLSREVGVPLLVRQGRGVRLSRQAHLLLDHAAVLAAQIERARADLEAYNRGEVGHVAFGAFATAITALVAPVVARLTQDRPRLLVTVHEVEAPACFVSLDSGDLDLVVTVEYRTGPHRGDPRYHRVPLLSDHLIVALPDGHRFSRSPAINLADLAEDPWIAGAMGGVCHEVSLAACTTAGFNPEIRHHTNDWQAVLSLVAAGCGVALIPQLAIISPPPGVALKPILGAQIPARALYAAVRAGSENSPFVAPILRLLQEAAARLDRRRTPQGPLSGNEMTSLRPSHPAENGTPPNV